jgi:hypothetical protein
LEDRDRKLRHLEVNGSNGSTNRRPASFRNAASQVLATLYPYPYSYPYLYINLTLSCFTIYHQSWSVVFA